MLTLNLYIMSWPCCATIRESSLNSVNVNSLHLRHPAELCVTW